MTESAGLTPDPSTPTGPIDSSVPSAALRATPIADPADARLEDYRELTDPAARARREGDEFFMIEGPTALGRALTSPYRLRSVLVAENRWARVRDELATLGARAAVALQTVPIYLVAPEVLTAVAGFHLHRGVISSADRQPIPDLRTMLAGLDPTAPVRAVCAEGLNDPENLGAIARTCRAFGVEHLWMDPTCIDPLYRRSVRVSMGEILHMGLARAGVWPDDLAAVRAAGITVMALTPHPEAVSLWDVELGDRVCLMVGAEGPGLSPAAMQAADVRVRIPISPGVDSLNVGAATAVACAELARRRR